MQCSAEQYCEVQLSVVLRNVVQCSVEQCSVIQCSVEKCSVVQCRVVQCSIEKCSEEQCSVVQCSVMQCSIEKCSVEQCSVVQCRAVQCSAIYFRMHEIRKLREIIYFELTWHCLNSCLYIKNAKLIFITMDMLKPLFRISFASPTPKYISVVC